MTYCIFFLSSTFMIFIRNSIIIRTARNRGIRCCLLELPCQYLYPCSLVSCSLELSLLFLSLSSPTFLLSLYVFLQYFLFTFYWSMFHHFHSLLFIFLRSTSTHTHVRTHARTHTHTRVPHTSSMLRCCFTGLSLCWTYIFIIPQYYHMPGEATILLSASHFDSHHAKIEQKKASQTDNMNALFKVLGFYNYISCFPKKSPCIGIMASHLAPSAGPEESQAGKIRSDLMNIRCLPRHT